MSPANLSSVLSRRFLQWGVVLFLLGLLTGVAMPMLQNPRMGLASHLEGILNGLFLMAVGLAWQRIRLAPAAARATFWLAVYGGFSNWLATLLAAWWGAGAMMALASGGQSGSAWQEAIISNLLLSLSAAMIAVCLLLIYGLRPQGETKAATLMTN